MGEPGTVQMKPIGEQPVRIEPDFLLKPLATGKYELIQISGGGGSLTHIQTIATNITYKKDAQTMVDNLARPSIAIFPNLPAREGE